MKILITSIALLSVLLVGCQSTQTRVADKENMLNAAGFVSKPASTSAQIAALQSLPAHKIVRVSKNNEFIYLYADPLVCDCIYAGNQAAYSRYNQMMFQQNLAEDQEMEIEEIDNFNYDSWGGYWGY